MNLYIDRNCHIQILEKFNLFSGPSLKVIGTLSELCDHIDVDECKRRNIQIITMPSISTEIVADLTVAALEGQLMSNEGKQGDIIELSPVDHVEKSGF